MTTPFANSLAAARPAAEEPSPLGSADGDLTRLALGEVDLARGGRTLRHLRTQTVAIEHLYTLDLDVRRGSHAGVEVRDARGAAENWEPAYRGGFSREKRSKVWHQLRLENNGTQPWTSGPMLVVRREADGPFPLAQEDLRYTAPGASTGLPLNLALGVEVEFWEESRGNTTHLSNVLGNLAVTNRIGTSIALRVRLGLGGRVTLVEGDAQIFESPGRDADWSGEERGWWRWHRDQNPHAEIEWSIELEPGATAKLAYHASFDVVRR